MLTTVNSGIDFVLYAAGILSSFLAFSYEEFVIDDEMCGIVRRYRHGISVTPETLAYDVIANVGPGGNILMELDTIARCRSEFWQPTIGDRDSIGDWITAGRPDEMVRARKRWHKLAEHQDPPWTRR
jgi:trimethylamine--corrinoid protein Co-methyltransferase